MDKRYDVIIVGTGAAGLYAALNFTPDVSVLLISKRELTLSNSSLAQGGVAAVLDKSNDNFKLHIADTGLIHHSHCPCHHSADIAGSQNTYSFIR